MKVLLVYPEIPSTFWSFKDALKFVSKKSAEPPLGLITIAAMLPAEWELKLIDMNVSKLEDSLIKWADYVFLSGMSVQIKSFKEVVRRCNKLSVKVVAGGPLVTTQRNELLGIDCFVLNEAEITLPQFLDDFHNNALKNVYSSEEYPEITSTPVPRYDLLKMYSYASMSVQYCRGCPYDCEFCSVTMLNGHKPRTKTTGQFLNELDTLYALGWRGGVSIVDDNFIGNKRLLKNELLPAMIKWSKNNNYPFKFITEVSINLSDDDDLMDLMIDAAINSIFVGIETPSDDGLAECGKKHNQKRDLVESVKKLQRKGFIVSGGFIVGFDSDTPEIFESQINFIQSSGIVSAMVGLLNAPTGTKLFKRLKSENRLLDSFTGDNMDGSINFRPIMNYPDLVNGYCKIIRTIYSQKDYYERLKSFLREYRTPEWESPKISFLELRAFLKSIWLLGILEKGRGYFWKLLAFSLTQYPRKFPIAVTLAVYGYHFRRVAATI